MTLREPHQAKDGWKWGSKSSYRATKVFDDELKENNTFVYPSNFFNDNTVAVQTKAEQQHGTV
jgi:hypothetical protein